MGEIRHPTKIVKVSYLRYRKGTEVVGAGKFTSSGRVERGTEIRAAFREIHEERGGEHTKNPRSQSSQGGKQRKAQATAGASIWWDSERFSLKGTYQKEIFKSSREPNQRKS